MKEQRDESGVLFKNDKKDSERHPDYKGSARIAGTDYWVSAWVKLGERGKFMSLAFSPKSDKPPERKPQENPVAQMGDDIPF